MWKSLIVSLALASGPGCATSSRNDATTDRTAGEVIDDATITTNVNAAIVGDEDARFFKIDVNTDKGHVMLRGSVNTREAEARLVARIEKMRGVRSVKSLLRVETTGM